MNAKLSRPQRRALEDLERGVTLAATHPTVITALLKRKLVTEHDNGDRHEITDAGRERLRLKRGRKPGTGPVQRLERAFLARQLELPLEVARVVCRGGSAGGRAAVARVSLDAQSEHLQSSPRPAVARVSGGSREAA